MGNTRRAKAMLISALQKMQAGTDKHLKGQTVMVNNVKLKADDIATQLGAFETQIGTTDAANADWKKLLVAQNATEKTTITPLMAGMVRMLIGSYGPQNPILADFGVAPRKTPVRTVQSKLTGIAKSKATRTARNTMGSRQRKAIHGTVAAPAPTTAPAAPAAPATATGGTAAK